MSLPGLQLSAPVEVIVAPSLQDLKAGTEWRFEVGFGTQVEVRVGTFSVYPWIQSSFSCPIDAEYVSTYPERSCYSHCVAPTTTHVTLSGTLTVIRHNDTDNLLLSSSPVAQSSSAPSSPKNRRTNSGALKPQSTPGMAANSRWLANAKSSTSPKKPP